MWLMILALALVLSVAGVVYLYRRFGRFGYVEFLAGDRRWLRRLLAAAPLLALGIYAAFRLVNAVIVLLHLAAFWLILDLIVFLGKCVLGRNRKASNAETEGTAEAEDAAEAAADAAADSPESDASKSGTRKPYHVYATGVIAILAVAVYLGFGWFNAHHVSRTAYEVKTEKTVADGDLRIVLFADSHIGTTFSGAELADYVRRINEEKPDIVVIVGDFVDDGTTKEDLVAACRSLSGLKATYGVYYVYGNHDKGYYNNRAYTPEELAAEIRGAGVTILEDEVARIADSVSIIGRKDRGERSGRKDIAELVKTVASTDFTIVLNHQPNDYDAESAAGVDLVLSGHTHGGQLLPLGPIGRLFGANDRTYGTEARQGTTFIVTSGISDWEIDFKTGTFSEYVVIDVVGK